MNTQNSTQSALIEYKTPLTLKLAALWTAFTFLYIYVDYFHLYMPKVISDLQAGRVFEFDITQGFLLFALVSVSIPAIMIFLSVALPAKTNRIVNLSIASLYFIQPRWRSLDAYVLWSSGRSGVVGFYMRVCMEVAVISSSRKGRREFAKKAKRGLIEVDSYVLCVYSTSLLSNQLQHVFLGFVGRQFKSAKG